MLKWMASTLQGAMEHNMASHEQEGATADADSAEKWCENMTPIITQYAAKDIFNMDETTIFYNEQAAIEDNGFKGRKVPRTE
jgi:hypothetical protein